MSIFTDIGHIFKKAGGYVGEFFIKVFGSDAAHAFASGAVALLKTELGKIATTAVQEASQIAQGVEAHGVAYAKIVAAAAVAGLETKESLINLLIELAVSALKGNFGITVPAATPAVKS